MWNKGQFHWNTCRCSCSEIWVEDIYLFIGVTTSNSKLSRAGFSVESNYLSDSNCCSQQSSWTLRNERSNIKYPWTVLFYPILLCDSSGRLCHNRSGTQSLPDTACIHSRPHPLFVMFRVKSELISPHRDSETHCWSKRTLTCVNILTLANYLFERGIGVSITLGTQPRLINMNHSRISKQLLFLCICLLKMQFIVKSHQV